jgi:ABC-2 type transport system ATP-binding protein
MMFIAEFNDIHRAYRRGIDVLDGVTFSVKPGEVVGLLGRNGAGKTTLMRIAMGMLEAQEGSVEILGMDPRKQPVEVKRRVGYVSEEQILPGFLSVEDILRLHRGLYPEWDSGLERDLIDRFALPRKSRIKSLSKGQARQVALLCALSHRPELLLLDEPAGGLDPAARREFLETSIQMLNEAGTTILFSSHYMSDVERLAGRVVLIHKGNILIDSELDRLREGYSLALLPLDAGVGGDRLLMFEDCLAVRERTRALHAVFKLPSDMSRELIAREFGVSNVNSRSVDLEEMFIELVGGQL